MTFFDKSASGNLQRSPARLQRKNAEKLRPTAALRESEEKYSHLFHHSYDAIFIHDLEGNILDVNQSALSLFNYDKFGMLSQRIQDLHPNVALGAAQEAFKKIERNRHVSFEIDFRKKNGSVFPAEVSSSLIEVGGRKVVQGVVRDITLQKEAEQVLLQQNEYLKALHEIALGLIGYRNTEKLLKDIVDRAGSLVGTPDGFIFLWDPEREDLVLRVGTGKFERMVGFRLKPGEGMAGKIWQSGQPLVVDTYKQWTGRHPDSRFDDIYADLGIPLKFGSRIAGVIGLCSYEKSLRFGDNEVGVLTRFADLATIALDNARLYTTLEKELNERTHAERALNDAHETFLTVLDGIDATIYVADMETYEILFMNRFMRDVFGSNLEGHQCWQVFRDESGPCPHCTNSQLIDENGGPAGLHVWECKNPLSGRWYLNHDRAIKWPDGRLVRLQIATDITGIKELEKERQQAEFQFRQSQKMEAIGTLAGGIAHDFNNILSAIIGYSELCLIDAGHGSTIETNLNEVVRAGKRARDLVKQILAFSRNSEHDNKPVQIGPIVKETLKMLRSTLPTTIDIQQEIAPALDNVLADPTHIHQIIMNLCTNAAHAMQKQGGTLKVSAQNANLPDHSTEKSVDLKPGAYVRLIVRDSGHGIPNEIMEVMFDPYFTTKQHGEGTGLGLSVVHGIVNNYGGGITATSEPGQGASFEIYLPAIRGRQHSTTESAVPLPSGSERILYVDDELPLVDMGKKMLESLGYEVTTRTSSIEALELFRRKPNAFDLVITDMTMPNMTGDKLTQAIMEVRPDIPVILCTGYSNQITKLQAKAIGIETFLFKPVVMDKLARAIRNAVDKTRQ